jgi:septum formation topological specificity factor MinE
MDALTSALGVIGLALAALIAGGFSLLSIILSKEKAVSKFRQTWIDELRSDIASLVAHTMEVTANPLVVRFNPDGTADAIQLSPDLYPRFYSETREDSVRLHQSMTRIRLRLNPHDPEPESAQILELLDDLDNALTNFAQEGFLRRIEELTDAIEHAAQPLLKKEWTRVKQGERVYRIAKKIALWSSVILAALLLTLAFAISGFFLGALYASKQPAVPGYHCNHVHGSH